MAMVSSILIWREDGVLYSRLTTNASKRRLLARLAHLGQLEAVEEIHPFFGDRAEGGTGYDLVWTNHVQQEDLLKILDKL